MTLAYDDGGAGDPVVLLHSSAADSRMWDSQWEALTARFRVIRPDLRGHGRTPYASETPYSDPGDVADLLAALAVERAVLVGSSYGGRVALQVATAHPALVSRLVLLNPHCGLEPTPDLAAFGEEEDRLLEAGRSRPRSSSTPAPGSAPRRTGRRAPGRWPCSATPSRSSSPPTPSRRSWRGDRPGQGDHAHTGGQRRP